MKYLKILSCLLLFTLASCGNEQPILNNSSNPYIVKTIKEFNKTHASYYNGFSDNSGTTNNFFGSWRARIVLPKGMYNIGDTIVVSRKYN